MKRVLTTILTVVLTISCMTVSVSADEADTEVYAENETVIEEQTEEIPEIPDNVEKQTEETPETSDEISDGSLEETSAEPMAVETGTTADGLEYTIYPVGIAAITGYSGQAASVTIPSSVNGVPVTTIGVAAFKDHTELTDVVISKGVTDIYPTAFSGCSGLQSVTIPDGVANIDSSAFYGCTALTGITIPESVTSLGQSAFDGCTALKEITIPSGITEIERNTFESCSNLSKVTISGSVTTIGTYAFFKCENLKSINLPKGLTSIADRAFEKCTSLENVTFPKGLVSIGSYAFCNCKSLTEVIIPEGTQTLGEGAFVLCDKLTRVTVPSSVTTMGDTTLDDPSAGTASLTFGGADLQYVNCPAEFAKAICNDSHSSLKTLVINSGKAILDNAFCTASLESVTLPDTLESIGKLAFYNCENLKIIAIPVSIRSFGARAFDGCPAVITYASGIESWKKITGWEDVSETHTVKFAVKSTPSVKKPTAKTLAYTGKAQKLVNAGSTSGGTLKYSLTKSGTYTTSVPKATAVGIYKVYYKVEGDENYNSTSVKAVTVNILPAKAKISSWENKSTGIRIAWKKVTGASGYIIYRGTEKIKTIKSGTTLAYLDKTVQNADNAGKFVYYVKAYYKSSDGTVLYGEKSAGKAAYRLKAPAKFSAAAAAGYVKVSFTKPSRIGYEIYRAASKNGTYTMIKAVTSGTSYKDTSVRAGKTYYYKIRTYKTIGKTKVYSDYTSLMKVTAK